MKTRTRHGDVSLLLKVMRTSVALCVILSVPFLLNTTLLLVLQRRFLLANLLRLSARRRNPSDEFHRTHR